MSAEPDRQTLELRKLSLEVRQLETDLASSWTKTYWPVFWATLVGIASLAAYVLAGKWQQSIDQRSQLERSLVWATDKDSSARRAAGAASLGYAWGQGYDEVIGSALIALLVDPSATVRRSAIESIELAVTGDVITACKRGTVDSAVAKRIRVLYGDGHAGTGGIATRQLAALEESTASDYKPGEPPRAAFIKASKDSIRKNWECLRGANLGGLDLSDMSLFQANLQETDLRDTDLTWVDLWQADLTSATLSTPGRTERFKLRSIKYANIAEAKITDSFRRWALTQGAVEMTFESYDVFHKRWRSQDRGLSDLDWPTWSLGGFKIDEKGCPISREEAKLLSCPEAQDAL